MFMVVVVNPVNQLKINKCKQGVCDFFSSNCSSFQICLSIQFHTQSFVYAALKHVWRPEDPVSTQAAEKREKTPSGGFGFESNQQ